MAIWKTNAYAPIACITSRSEGNETVKSEKVNVCTQGKAVSKANFVKRTGSISGEIINENSYHDLQKAQNSLEEQTFRIYRGTGDQNPLYFNAVIDNCNAEFDASTEGADGTFTMDYTINGEYMTQDPKAGG